MSGKWDRMTREAWKNSEVMQEFEKNFLESVSRFEKLAQTLHDEIMQVTPALKDMAPAAETAAEGVEKLDEALSSGDDGLPSEEDEFEPIPKSYDEYEDAIADEDPEEAKARLLAELRDMAIEAAYKGNIKLAYKIERAMDEIREE